MWTGADALPPLHPVASPTRHVTHPAALGEVLRPYLGGTDVLKAIALGARMVLVGRPFNYAAAVAGEAGVQHAIGLLRDEVDRNLAMLGASACTGLGPEHIVRRCS